MTRYKYIHGIQAGHQEEKKKKKENKDTYKKSGRSGIYVKRENQRNIVEH